MIFQRSELLFNDKPAIMINVRAVKDEDDFNPDLQDEIYKSFLTSLLKPVNKCDEKVKTLMD